MNMEVSALSGSTPPTRSCSIAASAIYPFPPIGASYFKSNTLSGKLPKLQFFYFFMLVAFSGDFKLKLIRVRVTKISFSETILLHNL